MFSLLVVFTCCIFICVALAGCEGSADVEQSPQEFPQIDSVAQPTSAGYEHSVPLSYQLSAPSFSTGNYMPTRISSSLPPSTYTSSNQLYQQHSSPGIRSQG